MAIHGSSRGRGHVWLVLLAVLGAALVSLLALPQWDSAARADEQKGSSQQITLERSADPAFQRELTEASNGGAYEPRIIGGTPVPDGKYPFMAILLITLRNGSELRCGGTLIDQDSVLTAAHCLIGPQTSVLTADVGVGGTVISQTNWEVRSAIAAEIPDSYKPGVSSSYDAAVVKLDSAVTGIKPIQLATARQNNLETPGRVLTVAGWGKTSNPDPGGVDRMNEVSLRVVSDATAQQAWSPRPPLFHYFPPLMVATDAQEGKNIAQGDSGGPLFNPGVTPTQVGIVSYGATTATPGSRPAAYTEINNPEIRTFIVKAATQ
jgi:secreted trypsin-like serine protease